MLQGKTLIKNYVIIYCHDLCFDAYKQTCPPGEFLVTHIDGNYWECVEEGIGPEGKSDFSLVPSLLDFVPESKKVTTCPVQNGYHVCPSDDVDPPPSPDDVTENPLGNCRCNGELWIAEGCRYGFICDEAQSSGGEYIYCADVSI